MKITFCWDSMSAFLVVALSASTLYGQSTMAWRINKPTLAVVDADHSTLKVGISRTDQAGSVELSAPTALSSIDITALYNDRLVIGGQAGNVGQVIIFDLAKKRQLDAFYCYQPTYLDRNFIAYVEWYPGHPHEKVTDVVLVYDLNKSPSENRLTHEPVNFMKPGIEVGFPVYPESNLRDPSYDNTVEDDGDVRHVIGLSPFLLLDSGRLVFVSATGGGEFRTLSNYLVDINLSNELEGANVRIVQIPKSTLKSLGENPNFVRVLGIKALSGTSVALSVPATVYGVGEIVVGVP